MFLCVRIWPTQIHPEINLTIRSAQVFPSHTSLVQLVSIELSELNMVNLRKELPLHHSGILLNTKIRENWQNVRVVAQSDKAMAMVCSSIQGSWFGSCPDQPCLPTFQNSEFLSDLCVGKDGALTCPSAGLHMDLIL